MKKKTNNISILVIEDNEMFRNLSVDMLVDYTTYTASTAGDGINKFKKYMPDITFVDIGLPDSDGHNVLSSIKAINPDAFMVMLTASSLEKDVQEAIKNGARGYIVKPFSRQKIKECIEQYELFCKKLEKTKVGAV